MCDLMIPEGMTDEELEREAVLMGLSTPPKSPLSKEESVAALRISLIDEFKTLKNQPAPTKRTFLY